MRRFTLACWVIGAAQLAAACAANDSGNGDSDPEGAGTGGPGGGFGGPQGGTCEPVAYQGQALPLNLFLVVDGSKSMANGADKTPWTATAAAVKTFASSPGAAGVGMGVLVFPRVEEMGSPDPETLLGMDCSACAGDACTLEGGCTCGSVPIDWSACSSCATGCGCWSSGSCAQTSCTDADYLTPDVDIGSLPGAEPAITQTLEGWAPRGSAATGLAYERAAAYATGWALNRPDQSVALLLIAAGAPNACAPTDPSDAAAAAASSAAAIRTYVISIGDVPEVNGVAAAGGSVEAATVSTADLAAELEDVQRAARSCVYSIPVPASGTVDPAKVNVRVHGSDANLKQVGGAAACAEAGGGWYFDAPASPRKIVLCHQSCGPLDPAAGGGVDVLLGCDTDVLK